jgi:predicted HTH transcriptional regulator
LRSGGRGQHPTHAGMLMFGVYPLIFELQLFIAYLQYYGTTTTEEAPSGERFLDNRKFEGTIKEVRRLPAGQSTRNRLLMHLMEDVHLVENRGSGIDAMLDAMQKRGLPAPVFEDKRTAFLVKFYQKTPIETPLADEEQRILAYVKKHGFIKRADAQEMLDVNEARARYLLQKMQKAGQLRKEGRYRDARYLPGYQ